MKATFLMILAWLANIL
jgi:hypothetical protein